jgi:hypothetical protein
MNQDLDELLRLLQRLVTRLERIEERLSSNPPEDRPIAYSTREVAQMLGKAPFTIREWCRLGRVNAFRAQSGRGPQPDWRISREEVCRIRSEGLLPVRYAHRIGNSAKNTDHQMRPTTNQVAQIRFLARTFAS